MAIFDSRSIQIEDISVRFTLNPAGSIYVHAKFYEIADALLLPGEEIQEDGDLKYFTVLFGEISNTGGLVGGE